MRATLIISAIRSASVEIMTDWPWYLRILGVIAVGEWVAFLFWAFVLGGAFSDR